MKTNLLMFTAVMLVSLDAAAKHDYRSDRLIYGDLDAYKVIYKKAKGKMTMYNEAGDVIFSDSLTHDHLSSALMDSIVPSANYTIEYTDGESQFVLPTPYKVEVKKVLNESDRIIQISNAGGDDEKIILAITKAQNKNYLVDIYDATDGIKHKDTLLV